MPEHAGTFDRDAAIATARALVDRLPDADLRAAYLFGSVAWGDADAASDLDLGLLLDRPDDDRAVVRARVADLVPGAPPGGPRFADLAYQTVARFEAAVARGEGGPRLARAVILRDTGGWLAGIRDRGAAAFVAPAARGARWRAHADRAGAHRAAAVAARDADPPLAALHARLALEGAVGGLIEADGGRLSLTHFLGSGEGALRRAGLPGGMAAFRDLLGLAATAGRVAASRRAYRRCAGALADWLADPAIRDGLPAADRAWAAFTSTPETYAEMAHKVAVLPPLGRGADLQFYLDGTLTTVIRMNLGKVVRLRAGAGAGIPTIPEFHLALRAEPGLYDAWVGALRLDALAARLPEALALVDDLLARGEATYGATAG
jgi:hypothetical protein